MISKHNIKDGFINCGQICGSKKIKNVLELGYQPLADDLKNFGSNKHFKISKLTNIKIKPLVKKK